MRIRKRNKIPISTSDLETPTSYATHVVEGSTGSSTGAPPPVAAGGGGGVLHLDGDLLPKSSGCNTYGSSVGGGDLLLPVPTQMKATLLKHKGEERTDVLGNLHSFNNNSTWEAESSFLVEKRRGGDMEAGEKKNPTKTNKTKYSTTKGGYESGGEEKKSSKRTRPAVLMEGSRCSRVNGRGWRCCQQTLVGYSLCEHHLGKGRLRSVNNNNTSKFKNNRKEGEDMKVVISGRKRKIGFVKARSISSLLDDTNADVNSNSNVIIPTKDEVLVAAATRGRTDQVSSMEINGATMV